MHAHGLRASRSRCFWTLVRCKFPLLKPKVKRKKTIDKLRKQNEKLRTDLQATEKEVEKLSKLVTCKSQDGASSCPLSPGQSKSVDFISSQYDGIMEQLQSIKAKLSGLDHKCNELRLAIDEMQAYSYQYNIKIFGLPTFAERENSESTAKLCIQLFHSMGVKDVSMQDIDIAHRVPARKASSRPNPIICKFVRRQVKERMMTARKEFPKSPRVSWVTAFKCHCHGLVFTITYLRLTKHC